MRAAMESGENMVDLIQRRAKTGYVHNLERPGCGNCQQCDLNAGNSKKPAECVKHEFQVGIFGWCPHWEPTEEWQEDNANAALLFLLGVEHGHAPEEASKRD